MLLSASVSSLHQVSRDIDAQYFSTEFRLGQRRGAIAATEIQHLHSFCDSKFLDERLAAFAHRIGNPREIAFFPKCFVRISRSIHNVTLSVAAAVSAAT